MKTWQQMMIGIILLTLVTIPVSADYPMFHADTQRTGLAAGDGPVTEAELWSTTTAEWADGSPVVADGRVYVTTWPDMDFGDGEELYLYCLDATTGIEIWKNPLGTGAGSVSGAAIADGKIFVGGTDNRLYCIDSTDGSTLWSETVDDHPYFGLSCSPLVDGGRVMVTARHSGTFHSYSLDGSPHWTFQTGGGVSQFTSPAAGGGLVYFAGNDSTLYCVDPGAKSEEWNVTLDGTIMSTPVIGAGIVYVTTGETLYALSASDGSEVWNKNIDASFATPALDGDSLYAGAADGLYRFAADTGNQGWHFACAKVDCSPVVANGIIYIATNEQTGKLYGVEAATGTEVWRYTLPSAGGGTYAAFYSSSPAVSDGVLYIGAENNRFYAFGEGAAAAPVEPEMIYSGAVTLTEGETFDFVPSNNASASYELDRTTDIGALDAAATAGGFTFAASDEWYASFGSFLLEEIDGVANEDWTQPDAHSWAIYRNGAAAAAGLGANTLADGDTLTFYYCPTDPSTYAPLIDEATYIVEIDVTVSDGSVIPEYIYEGTVTLTEGETFGFVPSNNASASYEMDRTTDIGALDAAATAGGFTFAASDEWYASFGSFLLEEIDGVANEDWTQPNAHSWAIYRNGAAAAAGLGANTLADGDTLTLYYCPTDPSTYAPLIDEATYIVEIDVTISRVATSGFAVIDAARGGTARAIITVTAQDAGWYAVVVSGVNSGGDSLAGIATVRLDAGIPVEIPVLIAVPQQAQTGAYTLYAGIYTLDDYPDDMLCHCEGLECVVS